MNRNLDGTLLTTEQLKEIAALNEEDWERIKVLHNDNLIHSKLLEITANHRYEMFAAGELKLDTSFIPEWKEVWKIK